MEMRFVWEHLYLVGMASIFTIIMGLALALYLIYLNQHVQ